MNLKPVNKADVYPQSKYRSTLSRRVQNLFFALLLGLPVLGWSVLGWSVLAWPGVVFADVVKPALVEISVYSKGEVHAEIRASIEAVLTGINGRYKNTREAPNAEEYDALRVLRSEELQTHWKKFEAEFLSQVAIRFDGHSVPLQVASVEIPPAGYTKVPRISVIHLVGEVPSNAKTLTWYYPLAFGDNAVRVRQVNEAKEQWHWSQYQWIRTDEASEPFSLTEVFAKRSVLEVIGEYIVAGFEHIIPLGLDHILFILGIFLLSTRLKPLLWQATMFTVAHTITLGLAASGVFELPANIVEPLIALSIAYIAFENIWHKQLHRGRLVLVFGFGLLHGMGFASVLKDFGMPEDAFFTALISFNVGVELGQLAVIGTAMLLVGVWASQRDWYRNGVVIPASLMIGLVGLYWTWDRIQIGTL